MPALTGHGQAGLPPLQDADAVPPGEPVRLVIWDLDDTLWQGTLTEGGIRYRADAREIIETLNRRGIVSAVCSKNTLADARAALLEGGLWDLLVFPSIDWTPKGPRIRALLDTIQLRAQSVLFIDDNHGNRAEAQHYARGLRVASEAVIPHLLASPLLRGKDDAGLSRLRHYRLLQARKDAELRAGGDADEFLRASKIEVTVTHELDAHFDRIIELVNRTNQLNFTKQRLPEDPAAARAALAEALSSRFIKAGLISVTDRYGDYGPVGFYMLHHQHAHAPRLVHFCFSCRVLNMGVETWLYAHLGRPALRVEGPVLTDILQDQRDVDWINIGQGRGPDGDNGGTHGGGGDSGQDRSPAGQNPATARNFDYVLLRGGCDIHTISHYFRFTGAQVLDELHSIRDGVEPTISHSIMLRHAVLGTSAEFRAAAAPLGYVERDFASRTACPPAGDGVWLFSFAHDNMSMLYRYKPTGELLPVRSYRVADLTRTLIGGDPAELGLSAAFLQHLEQWFEYHGAITSALFEENLRLVFDRAPAGTKVFVILGNELAANAKGLPRREENNIARNGIIRKAAANYGNVFPVAVTEFFEPSETPILTDHWSRETYYRLFRLVMERCRIPGAREVGAPPKVAP